jgi:outer membrane protein TolC
MKALKNSIESIVSQKKANNGNYMPNVNLNLSYIKLGEDASLNVNEPAIDEQQTATVTLNWNLYNAGRDYSQDIIFQKRILQYKEELEALKLSIQLQYEKAIEEFDVSKLNYETAKVSLAQSEENYKIVNNRFKEGLSTTTDLINANYLLTSAKQSFDNAYYDRFLAKAALDRVFEK